MKQVLSADFYSPTQSKEGKKNESIIFFAFFQKSYRIF